MPKLVLTVKKANSGFLNIILYKLVYFFTNLKKINDFFINWDKI